jgi:putative transposase
MVRGINKSAIFDDDQDKPQFLERLGQKVTEASASVYAWAVIDSHAHILKRKRKSLYLIFKRMFTSDESEIGGP